MEKNQDIRTLNSKGEYHGYQQWVNSKGVLVIRGIAKDGNEIGYEEWHSFNKTNFYIR